MKKQGYSNHRKYNPYFHGLLLLFVATAIILSSINLIQNLDETANLFSSYIILLVSIILGFFYYFIRQFAVKLQDRVIRSEENFRHFILTGKPMDIRLEMSQIIALRFAPDLEFPDLCKRAADEHLSNTEIKKIISRWKGDYHRI